MQKTASRAILEQLAGEQRRVVATWRALILLRRATFAIPADQRRWSRLPENVWDVKPILEQMEWREEVARIPGLQHVYEVTVPYANTGPLDEYEILMEAHPYCALSHASALSFHGLTNDLEKRITVTMPSKPLVAHLLSSTVIEDWEDLSLPTGMKVPRIFDRPITWHRVETARFFGVGEYRRFRYPLRVTDRERTLVDGLIRPDLCGGLENVLRAWVLGRDVFSVDTIFEYVDRLDITVLRQRVGFVMSTLGISHPVLEVWRGLAPRGGSSRLLASAPYSTSDGGAEYSEEWNLAINAPITVLQEAGM